MGIEVTSFIVGLMTGAILALLLGAMLAASISDKV